MLLIDDQTVINLPKFGTTYKVFGRDQIITVIENGIAHDQITLSDAITELEDLVKLLKTKVKHEF